MQLVLVRTVTGLEWLAAEELATAGHQVVEVGKRQVVVEPASDSITRPITRSITGSPPRLADDLFVVYAAIADPGHTKTALTAATDALRGLLESPGDRGTFAVSASFVGVRNFNRYDVEDLVGERLARLTGGQYHSRRGGVVPPDHRAEWRVVLDGKMLWIARRPYDVPLHRRAWRQRTVPGSLHPPVAAAMARLAGLAPGHDVLDPFCGAGTVLLEAHLLEPRATYVGLDRDPDALAAAHANCASADASVRWRRGDAGRFEEAADRIVTNPPWNVRLGIGDLAPHVRRWHWALRPGGLLVAILNRDQAAGITRGWRVHARHEVAVAGRHPVIVVAEPSRG